MSISDSSLNLLGILGWGNLQQSPVKSWFYTQFSKIEVMFWAVPPFTLLFPLAMRSSAADA